MSSDSDLQPFISWFEGHDGFLDCSVMGITVFPGQGRAGVALTDIPEGHTLFTIPRSLTLSTRTSDLPGKFGAKEWKQLGLHSRWVGLILCMMWEQARGVSSKWSAYLESLPTSFDTPMFWTQEELEELKGTTLVGKIGKHDVEQDYQDILIPALKSRPTLFPEELIATHYSMEKYHIMGSRILSRSFHVEAWRHDREEAENEEEPQDGMDVDEQPATQQTTAPDSSILRGEESVEDDEEEEEEDEEDPSDVAMVPMADILNARYGSENAKLFHEETHLRMISTRPIKAGEQIWNTYGDPPNSDLLRKYGHVDLVPLAGGGEGNPNDVVEVRADLVISSIPNVSVPTCVQRIDWWLEEGGADTFVLESDLKLPDEWVSMVRLLSLPEPEWQQARDKSKMPKPKLDSQVISSAIDALKARLGEYPTTIQADEDLLAADKQTLNKKNAIIVRLGEKKILSGTYEKLQSLNTEGVERVTKRKGAKVTEDAPGKRSKR